MISEKDLAKVGDVEVEPLTDKELESAAGGQATETTTCPITSGCPIPTRGCPPAEAERQA